MRPNTIRPGETGLRRPSRRALVAAGAAAALALTGCGSRLGQARLEATNNAFKRVVDQQSAAAGPGAAADTTATTAGGVAASGTAPAGGTTSLSGGSGSASAAGPSAGN